MNDRTARIVVVAGLALAGAAVALTVQRHEDTLAHGRVVLLPLAQADPRSLMQGDYMALAFRIGADLATAPADGHVVVKLDEQGVGGFARLDDGQPLAQDEVRIRYRVRKSRVRIATDAWFFEEGHAGDVAGSRFGELRVRPDGEALLVALRKQP